MESKHRMYMLMNKKGKQTTIALMLETSFVVDFHVQAKTIQALIFS